MGVRQQDRGGVTLCAAATTASAVEVSLSISAGVRCSCGLIALFGWRVGGDAAPLPGAGNGNNCAEAISRIPQMRGLVRGVGELNPRRRPDLYTHPRVYAARWR